MRTRNWILSGLTQTCAILLLAGVLVAWTEPTGPPYTAPVIPTGDAGDVATGCKCQTAHLKQPTASEPDWPSGSTEQTAIWDWWRNGVTTWTRSGAATNTYNCFSYAFNGGSHWLDDPSNFIGDKKGCWHLQSDGTVRKSSGHACMSSYTGKCGRMFVQDHNDDVYGTMPDLYKKLDADAP